MRSSNLRLFSMHFNRSISKTPKLIRIPDAVGFDLRKSKYLLVAFCFDWLIESIVILKESTAHSYFKLLEDFAKNESERFTY